MPIEGPPSRLFLFGRDGMRFGLRLESLSGSICGCSGNGHSGNLESLEAETLISWVLFLNMYNELARFIYAFALFFCAKPVARFVQHTRNVSTML